MQFRLGPLRDAVEARSRRLLAERVLDRIEARDPTVWAADGTPEIVDRLGWLDLPQSMQAHREALQTFAADVRHDCDCIVLCGMGGSSLAPEVLWRAFGSQEGFPSFHLLDSTHPEAVAAVERRHALNRTLFIVASKSGTTIETTSFQRFFWRQCGEDGGRFVAITDPDTPLARDAEAHRYRRVFLNPPDIGGRFSALSLFGLVPAAALGIDPGRLLEAAARTDRAAYVRLGAVLAEAARAGRDKVTILPSPSLEGMGLWLEQLLAESTGKDGQGLLPVVEVGSLRGAGTMRDRTFVSLRLGEELPHADLDTLADAGHPVIAIDLSDAYDVAREFIGWELATAVAAHGLGVHPFNQPNVAESKTNTARVLEQGMPAAAPATPGELGRFLAGIPQGAYLAVTAFLPPDAQTDHRLAALQASLRDRLGTTVTVCYGPRYLHSTGQYHKGGPASGSFLQVVDMPTRALPIPGMDYSFADLIAAQAEGDRLAHEARGRPVLRLAGWDLLEREQLV